MACSKAALQAVGRVVAGGCPLPHPGSAAAAAAATAEEDMMLVGLASPWCVEAVRRAARLRVSSVRAARRASAKARGRRREIGRLRSETLEARCAWARSLCAGSLARVDSRLARLEEAADRRLTELARECVGEREKVSRQLEVCAARGASKVEAERCAARARARWALFLARIENASLRDDDSTSRRAAAALEASMNAPIRVLRCAVVRGAPRSPKPHARDPRDLFPAPNRRERARVVDPETYVVAAPLAWLALAAPEKCFVEGLPAAAEDPCVLCLGTARVYYEVTRPVGTAETALANAKKGDGLVRGDESAPLGFRSGDRLFAPATARHVSAVSALYVLASRCPARNGSGDDFPLDVRRLSPCGVRLLLNAFTSSDTEDSPPLPACPDDRASFSLLAPRAWGGDDSLLVAWTSAPPDRAENADEPTVADVCEWRACARDGRRDAQRVVLCAWHADLKAAISADESSRYLPPRRRKKKHRYHHHQDSALLAELWNGKLGATVQVFCERAAAESSSSVASQTPPPPPRWTRWRETGALATATAAVSKALEVAETVAAVERAATDQLALAASNAEFPHRTVLSLIRRERARVDRARSDDDADRDRDEKLDLDFARRKLEIFRAARAGRLPAAEDPLPPPKKNASPYAAPSIPLVKSRTSLRC